MPTGTHLYHMMRPQANTNDHHENIKHIGIPYSRRTLAHHSHWYSNISNSCHFSKKGVISNSYYSGDSIIETQNLFKEFTGKVLTLI